MRVYLPEYEHGWVTFEPYDSNRTGAKKVVYKGGGYIDVQVNANRIPVFRKADQTVLCAPVAVPLGPTKWNN